MTNKAFVLNKCYQCCLHKQYLWTQREKPIIVGMRKSVAWVSLVLPIHKQTECKKEGPNGNSALETYLRIRWKGFYNVAWIIQRRNQTFHCGVTGGYVLWNTPKKLAANFHYKTIKCENKPNISDSHVLWTVFGNANFVAHN